jgi:hypothetical protein
MKEQIVLSRAQVSEMHKAVNGIGALLRHLPARPEKASVLYAIMSNLSVIQMQLAESTRFDQN